MNNQQSQACLTSKEEAAAGEGLLEYCKLVELYNILQDRALRKPLFLQRCLKYKIKAKHRHRVQITVSLSGNENVEIEEDDVFPLQVLLGRPLADVTVTENSAVYRLSQNYVITTFTEFGEKDQVEANFVIPEINKLATNVRIRNLHIILVKNELGGNCLWGKMPIGLFCSSLETYPELSLGHQIEVISTCNMHPGFLEPYSLKNCMTFHSQNMDSMSSYLVQVSVFAQEIGAAEMSPYDSYSYDHVPTSSLAHFKRLRSGNVVFNYSYQNNTLQKTEVTEDFSCPFCLVKCASYEGLKYHLTSSHDLFNYWFWVTKEFQVVNVSVKTDIRIFKEDPSSNTFLYCSPLRRHRRSRNIFLNASHGHPHALESDSPEAAQEGYHDNCPRTNGTTSSPMPFTNPTDSTLANNHNDGDSHEEEDSDSHKEEELHKSSLSETQLLSEGHKSQSFGLEDHHIADSVEPVSSNPVSSNPDTTVCATTAQASNIDDCAEPVSRSSQAPATVLQCPKTRKRRVKQNKPRNHALLQRRQFFHSHGYQPMALEEVLADQDSGDETDNDVADIEDRRMLGEFVKKSEDEKQTMHLWNSFVRRQRVIADGHIPWACEAFSKLHGQDLAKAPGLLRSWRLFMLKLWNASLLDAQTMDKCNLILEGFQNNNSDPKQS